VTTSSLGESQHALAKNKVVVPNSGIVRGDDELVTLRREAVVRDVEWRLFARRLLSA
jgi:hypothetical protein